MTGWKLPPAPKVIPEARIEEIQQALEAAGDDWLAVAKELPEYLGHQLAKDPCYLPHVALDGDHPLFGVPVRLIGKDNGEWEYPGLQRNGKRMRYRKSWERKKKR